mmetsp:Transcript_21641/g.38572  ORF Transcript_21641/g.38572 Transcript_21641/m.38572 type:complete len:268 (-) Transcript_21641:133-936(-)|eukprot:CAMPEP_0177787218 /NCGR_PEP_ID=MMETSP0491_2-20121128/21354_1 /TAXON_ID=63592 /ORGANISM="Tetraselmis chuii, Strain PLY429" /LENGTH=267 /DNA_ID=CAMNT_0019308511 /DNA_START=217 /DNA_END=1020 /DNA_ORIENTATION=-
MPSESRRRSREAGAATKSPGKSGRIRASSARAPRVDTWWKTPKGRVPYEAPYQYQTKAVSEGGTLPNIPVSELNYSSWASPSRETKKLSPQELRKSVERLSTPYYTMRPMSAPVTRSTPDEYAATQEQGPLSDMDMAFRMYGDKKKKLSPTAQTELVERLYNVKQLPEIPEKRCLKLKYKFNPGLREGAGGYEERWEPVKVYNLEESIEAMASLRKRNDEKMEKIHKKLEDKYLQPLCTVKKVSLKDETVQEKIELLFKGQGTVKKT